MKIIENQPAVEYHAVDAASASRLKAMRRSAAHCRYQIDHPKNAPALAFGQLFHSVALEPLLIDSTYAIIPDVDRRTKIGKAAWEAFQLECAAKKLTPADMEDFQTARDMAAAIDCHPTARRLCRDKGRNELSCYWHEGETACKLRADRLVEVAGVGPVVVDLKTTTDASAEAFASSINRFGYHIQAAWYLAGLARCGVACAAFCIIAVEKEPPYGVGVYRISDEAVEQGQREGQRLLNQYAKCVKTGKWPGYSDKIEDISLPAWAFDEQSILQEQL